MADKRIFEKLEKINFEKKEIIFKMEYKGAIIHSKSIVIPDYAQEIIDDEDFHIDLLFYHRRLKRMIAVELKLGKFKAAYKGQMELYLKYLNKYECFDGE